MPHQNLTPSTVQAVRDLPILAVVGKHVTLTKNHEACCPFHNEKTPSFHVYPKTNTFKCFGCGKQGDGITFEMLKQEQGFIESVETLAAQHDVPLEYEASTLTPEQQKVEQERQQKRKDVAAGLKWATAWFRAQPMPEAFADRLLSEEIMQLAQVGYAPDDSAGFIEAANKNGLLAPVLMQAGLLKQSERDNSYFPAFRNRAMVPIRDARGRVVAFTGRAFDADAKAKYLNSGEVVWIKGEHLYGLDVAAPYIRKKDFTYLVEGHIDVLQMWNRGLWNTVGGAGTSLTDEQVALLARYTKHVVMVYDHDQAGRDALDKNAAKCIAAGLQVSFLIPAAPDAKGNYNMTREGESDPDSYLKALVQQSEKGAKKKRGQVADETTPAQRLSVAVAGWVAHKKDYLTIRAVDQAKKNADLGAVDKADAIRKLGELVELMPDTIRRETYYDAMGSEWPAFKKAYKLKKRAEPTAKADDTLAKLKAIGDNNVTDSFNYGFFEKDGAYWKINRFHQTERLCAFTIEMLYFVKAQGQPKYVARFANVWQRVRTAAFSTDDFVTVSAFDKALGRLHGFVFEGNQQDLNNIRMKKNQGIPEAIEVDRLGFNANDGDHYYAWANGLLYKGTFYPANKHGFVQLRHAVPNAARIRAMKPESKLELWGKIMPLNAPEDIFSQLDEAELDAVCEKGEAVEITHHFLPTAGDILRGADSDDTMSKFRHFQTGILTFEEWARRIVDVYGESNGRTLVAFYIAALFRSIIYPANNGYFPLLYHFGLKQSGKSTSARSLARMFGTPFDMDGTNLEGGSTQTGIGRMLATVENGIIWLNEYKNSLDKRIIGTLKGIADGSGKLLGMNTSGNETKVNRPRSTALIGGQDLPTQDPALFSRCIINEFDGKYHKPVAQKELQALEEAGHGTRVTCEVLDHYTTVATGYRDAARTCTADLTKAGTALLSTEPDSRAILNLASLLTPVKQLIDAQALKFPFTYAQLLETLTGKLGLSTEIQAVSDDVEIYLQTLAALPAMVLQHGFHYQVEKEGGRELLFIRTSTVHPLYLKDVRTQGGAPLGVGTVQNYLKKHHTFIETRERQKFAEVSEKTSCYVLDYYKLRTKHNISFRTEAAPHDTPVRPEPPKPTRNVEEEVAGFIGTLPLDKETPALRATFKELFDAFNEYKGMYYATDQEFNKALRVGSRLHTPKGLRIVTQEPGEAEYVVSIAPDPF